MNIYFLAALEQRWLIIFCVFLGVCATVWFLLDMFSKDTNQAAESRLDMLNDRKRVEKIKKGKAAGVDKLTRALEKRHPLWQNISNQKLRLRKVNSYNDYRRRGFVLKLRQPCFCRSR